MQFVDSAGKKSSSQRMLLYQAAAFGSIIILIWLNELLDLPALLLGAPETPVNWRESLLESSLVALVWAAVSRKTTTLFLRMKYLEGLLPVCATCKRIRGEDGGWQQIETYISARPDAEFTHGICPDCAERFYPGFNPYKQNVAA